GIHLPPEWAPVLSFLLFGSLLTIGQALQFNRTIKNQSVEDRHRSYQSKAFPIVFTPVYSFARQSTSWLPFVILVGLPISTAWLYTEPVFEFAFEWLPGSVADQLPYLKHYGVLLAIIVIIIGHNRANHRLLAITAVCLMGIFWAIILN